MGHSSDQLCPLLLEPIGSISEEIWATLIVAESGKNQAIDGIDMSRNVQHLHAYRIDVYDLKTAWVVVKFINMPAQRTLFIARKSNELASDPVGVERLGEHGRERGLSHLVRALEDKQPASFHVEALTKGSAGLP
jgi:hypothetical protein